MEQQGDSTYLTKSQLKERSWTDAAVKKFAGMPDTTKKNPVYRTVPPMLLYALDRIAEIEAGDEFKEWCRQSLKRKESANLAVDTKKTSLLDQVKEIETRVPRLLAERLVRQVVLSNSEDEQ